ncbi:MAG: hypothetical protein H6739_28805 [Alphaproteobacteria bacterium]|nr:hypothetical protein [Alphaproteobacteria bacterium]
MTLLLLGACLHTPPQPPPLTYDEALPLALGHAAARYGVAPESLSAYPLHLDDDGPPFLRVEEPDRPRRMDGGQPGLSVAVLSAPKPHPVSGPEGYAELLTGDRDPTRIAAAWLYLHENGDQPLCDPTVEAPRWDEDGTLRFCYYDHRGRVMAVQLWADAQPPRAEQAVRPR